MVRMILIVGFGGFLGSSVRFVSQRLISNYFPISFPLGTFIINILGCLLIGIIFGISEKANVLKPEMRMFLATGFCGGFTTFSTFSLDCIGLLRDSQYLYVFVYIALSVVLGLFATYLGILFIKLF